MEMSNDMPDAQRLVALVVRSRDNSPAPIARQSAAIDAHHGSRASISTANHVSPVPIHLELHLLYVPPPRSRDSCRNGSLRTDSWLDPPIGPGDVYRLALCRRVLHSVRRATRVGTLTAVPAASCMLATGVCDCHVLSASIVITAPAKTAWHAWRNSDPRAGPLSVSLSLKSFSQRRPSLHSSLRRIRAEPSRRGEQVSSDRDHTQTEVSHRCSANGGPSSCPR